MQYDDMRNSMKKYLSLEKGHFSITGSFLINPPSNAKLDVSWYANGGIVISPQLIGVGEAGAEAIVPLRSAKRLAQFGKAIPT